MRKISVFILGMLLALTTSLAWSQQTSSYIAVEANSGRLLYSHNAEQVRPIASLAQIATCLVALDWQERTRASLDTMIAVPPESVAITGGNPLGLRPGDRISLRDAIISSVLSPDNLSALTVAHYVGAQISQQTRQGGHPVAVFVTQMNNLARALGMIRTTFRSPFGLDSRQTVNTSCACDMALLGMYAVLKPSLLSYMQLASREITVESQTEGTIGVRVSNTNAFVGKNFGVTGVDTDGIKSARSRLAGECLMLGVKRRPYVASSGTYPQRMIVVVLGSTERYEVAQKLVIEGWRYWDTWARGGFGGTDRKEHLHLPNYQKR